MRAAGWLVEEVPNGEEALMAAVVLAPDAIVMDLRLPGIDGLEATRRLKADPDTQIIPIAALSVLDRAQGEPLATEAGCALYLSKPCAPEHLRDVVEQLVMDREESPP
jgi:two-component system cell cycle response regulator DivK